MKVSELIKQIREAVREKIDRDVPLEKIEIRYIDINGCSLDTDVNVIVGDGEICVEVS